MKRLRIGLIILLCHVLFKNIDQLSHIGVDLRSPNFWFNGKYQSMCVGQYCTLVLLDNNNNKQITEVFRQFAMFSADTSQTSDLPPNCSSYQLLYRFHLCRREEYNFV